MEASSRLKRALDANKGTSLGVWQFLPGTNISRAVARTAGIDWVLVDCEHGNFDGMALFSLSPRLRWMDRESLSRVLRLPVFMVVTFHNVDAGASDAAMHEAVPAIAACGVSPIVRVPGTDSWMIKRRLLHNLSYGRS